jgi:hypothetical protein
MLDTCVTYSQTVYRLSYIAKIRARNLGFRVIRIQRISKVSSSEGSGFREFPKVLFGELTKGFRV